MNPFSAGLPQKADAASNPIGSSAFFGSGPTLVKDAAGGEYLAAGVMVAANLYPKAAKLSHLQGHGTPDGMNTTLPTTQRWTVATDGRGVIIVATGSTTQVNRSADGGVTWAAIAVNCGGAAIYNVVWNPIDQRFYVFANSATNLFGQRSSNAAGTAFNASFTTGGLGGTPVVNTTTVAVNPVSGLMVARTQNTNNVAVRKVALGAEAFTSGAVTLEPNILSTLRYNAAGTLLVDLPFTTASSPVIAYSANDGVSWGNGGSTASFSTGETDLQFEWSPQVNNFVIFGANAAYWVVSGAPPYSSTNFLAYELPLPRVAGTKPSLVGAYLCIGLQAPSGELPRQLAVTQDGFRWELKNTSQGLGSVDMGLYAADAGINVVIFPVDTAATQNAILLTPSLDVPAYVGYPYEVQTGTPGALALFHKVK